MFVRKSEGNKPPERSGHRLEDNIKTDLRELECKSVGWNHLAQDRVHWWAFLNLWVL
jgi:hypothetical protein